jgi:hypothetical protein
VLLGRMTAGLCAAIQTGPRVEDPRECFVAFRPVLPTEYLNGKSRHDTGVVKGSRGTALMVYRQGVAFNASR